MKPPSVLDTLDLSHDAVISATATVVWRSPHASRPVDVLATGREHDLQQWADELDVELRLDLHGRLETQAVLGEPATVLQEQAEWVEVELPLQPTASTTVGHRGWIPRHHISTSGPVKHDSYAVLSGSRWVNVGRDQPALSYGSLLPVERQDGTTVALRMPRGGTVEIPTAEVTILDRAMPWGPEMLLEAARTFDGTPYLWGGMSGAGVDCSGLVHLSARALGRILPRDAREQATVTNSRELAEAAAGDLVFFRDSNKIHHVAIATGTSSEMFHAPRTGRRVGEGDWTVGYGSDSITCGSCY